MARGDAHDAAEKLRQVAQSYEPLERANVARGVLLAVFIGLCDVVLKLMAHGGGCRDEPRINLAAFDHLWVAREDCSGLELLGPLVTLIPRARHGIGFGLLEQQFVGFGGQAFGLGLLAFATIVTILVFRWRWAEPGDMLALGAIWAGTLINAAPRVAGSGHTFTEIDVLDFGVSLGDLALPWGLVWLLLRFLAELRAG